MSAPVLPSPTAVLAPLLTYEQARDLARSPDVAVRVALAGRTDVAPEILYFLSQDDAAPVRTTVAANPAAPVKANLRLADDADEAVREALATKVADAEKDGGLGDTSRQRAISRQVLDQLSRDRLTAVRAAIAESLKSQPGADHGLINRLARDLEILVAAPILEHSPVLMDEDLLDIIRSSPVQGALAAIARRAYVDPAVTEAIVASGDSHAITHLLYNANAHLQEHTLDSLIQAAGDQPDWQPPLIHRPELSEPAVRRLAEVVADSLLDRLMEREDLTPEAARELRAVVDARLRDRFGDGDAQKPARPAHPAGGEDLPSPYDHETDARFEAPLREARALRDKGKLTEAAVTVALLTDDVDGLVAELAVLSGLTVRVVLDILASQSARAIASLAWASGLSARFGLELQLKLGRIAMDHAVRPAIGGGYPLSEPEMRWQIEMYAEG